MQRRILEACRVLRAEQDAASPNDHRWHRVPEWYVGAEGQRYPRSAVAQVRTLRTMVARVCHPESRWQPPWTRAEDVSFSRALRRLVATGHLLPVRVYHEPRPRYVTSSLTGRVSLRRYARKVAPRAASPAPRAASGLHPRQRVAYVVLPAKC